MKDLVALQRARENDPDTNANANLRARAVGERLDYARMNHLARSAVFESKSQQKIIWLRALADTLGPATDGIAPCHEGCSHCCYIPALMHVKEARVIAQETGIPLRTPQPYSAKMNRQYIGVACPFLKHDRCSIYALRPITCRVHYNLDKDNLLCQMTGSAEDQTTRVPFLDPLRWHSTYHAALVEDNEIYDLSALQVADIRDFFSSETVCAPVA